MDIRPEIFILVIIILILTGISIAALVESTNVNIKLAPKSGLIQTDQGISVKLGTNISFGSEGELNVTVAATGGVSQILAGEGISLSPSNGIGIVTTEVKQIIHAEGINNVSKQYSGIFGGSNNNVSGQYSGIFGGSDNTVSGQYSGIFGGNLNTVSGQESGIFGGNLNNVSGQESGIFGGNLNNVSGQYNGIIGGSTNNISNANAFYSNIIGGLENNLSASLGSIIAGSRNNVSEQASGVFCGQSNTVSSLMSCILGGNQNIINSSGAYNGILAGSISIINSGSNSAILSGRDHIISSDRSVILGGTGLSTYSGTSYEDLALLGLYNDHGLNELAASTGSSFRLIVGNGNSYTDRKNAFSVDNLGNLYFGTEAGASIYTRQPDNSFSFKAFTIQHPDEENKWLVHGCLEGPEAGVYYRGKNIAPTKVSLPSYASKIANNFSVQLTPIGKARNMATSEVDDQGCFQVHGEGAFFWQVTGTRIAINSEPYKEGTEVKRIGPYTWHE